MLGMSQPSAAPSAAHPDEGKIVDGRIMFNGEWFPLQDALDRMVNDGRAAGAAFTALDAAAKAHGQGGEPSVWEDARTEKEGTDGFNGLRPHIAAEATSPDKGAV